jgi:hypothetical protein
MNRNCFFTALCYERIRAIRLQRREVLETKKLDRAQRIDLSRTCRGSVLSRLFLLLLVVLTGLDLSCTALEEGNTSSGTGDLT